MKRLAFLTVLVVSLVLAGGGGANDGCTPHRGDVAFRAADGVRLAGHVWGRGRVGVVLAHQSNGNLCQWTSYGARLGRLGYRTLAFDFRNYGDSQTVSTAKSARLGGDVAAAATYLRTHGVRSVFLVGASMGGSAVLQAGANVRPRVDGVVAVSAADYLVDATRSATRLDVPVLYLAGRYDSDLSGEARHLYHLTPGRSKQLVIANDGRHGVDLVDGNAIVRGRIEAFLASHAP